MLNVVHFSYQPNTASTNRLLSYLNNIPSNIEIRVFFLIPDELFSKLNNISDNVHVFYCWEKFNLKWFSSKFLKYLVFNKIIRNVRKEIKEGDVAYFYNIPSYIKKLKKKGVKYYGERTESPLVTGSSSRLIPFSLNEHIRICRQLDGIFVISTSLKKYYISQGVSPEKIHIINMTVDTSRFVDIPRHSIRKHKYIAYCGNVSNVKDGVDKLLRSFALVNKKHPDVYLYIIGSLKSNDPNILLAKSLGIFNNIIFTGKVDVDVVPELLVNAEICVLNRPFSLQAECGFPTKLGEYLLSENPVVITKVGDIPIFLQDGKSALFASPNDDQEFAEKILWALENPNEARRIGRNGAEVARMHFNAQFETSRLLKILLQI